MIFMVFADDVIGKPGQNDFGAREPYQTDDFLQGLAVSPGFERMKHVGARRVGTAQKPGVADSVCGERVPRLHLAHVCQSRRLFIAHGIAA